MFQKKREKEERRKTEINYIKRYLNNVWELADKLMKRFNPCQVRFDPNVERYVCMSKDMNFDFCCHKCKHLGEDGCTVRAPACKLFLCPNAALANPKLSSLLSEMRHLTNFNFNVPLFRESIDDIIRYLIKRRKVEDAYVRCHDLYSALHMLEVTINLYEEESK